MSAPGIYLKSMFYQKKINGITVSELLLFRCGLHPHIE